VKISQFIWERLRGPFVSGSGHVEYPETFHEELNDQCGRIIIFAALILTFAWLPYIPIDRELYPGEPLIISLRVGLSLVGFAVLILQGLRRFNRHSLTFLIILSTYLEAATGVITGLTKGDPAYMGGYLFVLTLMALLPIPRRAAWSILASSFLLFFAVGFANGMRFDTLRLRYSLNDLLTTVLIVALFVYLLDRLRFSSWEKSRKIGQQNETLRESEEYSTQLVAAIPDIVIRTNIQGDILYINEKGLEASGYAKEDIVGQNMLSFVAPDDREAAVQNTILMMEQPLGPKEYHLILNKGEKSIYEVNGSVLKKEDGVPNSMVYIVRDITERKRAEDALRESEEKLRLIVETIPHVVSIMDMNLHCTYMSPSIQRLLGYTPEEALALTVDQLMTPESLEIAMQAYREDLRQEHAPDFSSHHIRILKLDACHKDGSLIPFENTITFLRNDNGVPIGIVILSTDITERKLAEEALRESEDRLRTIIESIEDGYYEVDLKGNMTFCNPSEARMLGYTQEELIGMNHRQYMDGENARKVFSAFNEVYRTGIPTNVFDWEMIRKGGEKFIGETSVSLIRDTEGKPLGFRGVLRDVTIRKQAEEALRESEDRLRTIIEGTQASLVSVDAKGRFTYANDAMAKALGFKNPEELIGKPYVHFIHSDDRQRVMNNFVQQTDTRQPSSVQEFRIVDRDNRAKWFSFLSTLTIKDGQVVGQTGVAQNITERMLAEDALRKSEEKYKFLIENTSDIIWIFDLANMAYSFVSSSLERMLGYSADEAVGMTLDNIFSPETKKAVQTCFRRIIAGMESSDRILMEAEHIAKNGSRLWMEINAVLKRDELGRPVAFNGVTRDISGRKRMEALREESAEALRESEARYRSFFEQAAVGVAEIEHVTGRFLTANRLLCTLLGRTEEEMRDTTFQAITHPDDLHLHEEKSEQLLAGKIGHYTLEKRYISKDGAVIWVNIAVSNPEGTGKTDGRNIVVVENITERKRAEAALQASEEKFRQIVNSIPNAVSMLDMNLRLTYMSAGVQRILGYTPEEAMTFSLDQICTPESLAIAFKTLQERLEANAKGSDPNYVLILELEEYHKNGSTVCLENTMTFLRDANGAPVGILCVSADISERKRAQAELKEAKDAAEAANQSKSIFLANMSHEIRTPMNAILGFAQLMQRDSDLSPKSREHLNIINRSGEHLLTLINDILEMSKIEAGRVTFVPNTFDLAALLEDIELMFRMRTEAKKLQFLVGKVGNVPRWVVSDERKLRQVLINLLGNAVKFTGQGGIALRLGAKAGKTDAIDLQFEVEDTGPGMAEDEIGRLFQAFEQTKTGIQIGGTGLGLALSRGFIQIMGGSISVASAVGKGTTFHFEIPVQEGKEGQTPVKITQRRVVCVRPDQGVIRVLIADDKETNRLLLSQILSSAGFQTQEVANGAEAVEAVGAWNPRIVLMDMAMPVMDGYEATHRLKTSQDHGETLIIAVTASAFEEDRKRVMSAGADGYLAKPFKEAELFALIGALTGVEYLYEEDRVGEQASKPAEVAAEMREAVTMLPPDLVDQLRDAAEGADLDRLNELVGQLATDQPTLAKRMQEMAARFEYEALIELLSQGA
jgi:PAS domain S-box-containing protein